MKAQFQYLKTLPLLCVDLLFYSFTFAQTTKPIIVKTGTGINEGIPAADLYQYSQFVKGKAFFRNGTSADAKLNYNRFLDEMQFINTTGDTLTLDNEETIRLITAENDSFYYDKGYMRLLDGSKPVKLAVKQGLKILDKQKTSAYDGSSSVSSIRNVNTYNDEGRVNKIGVAENIVLVNENYYYLGDQYNHFVLANKKNLLELLPKHEHAIRKYLKENQVEFQKKDDLEKLIQFLTLL